MKVSELRAILAELDPNLELQMLDLQENTQMVVEGVAANGEECALFSSASTEQGYPYKVADYQAAIKVWGFEVIKFGE